VVDPVAVAVVAVVALGLFAADAVLFRRGLAGLAGLAGVLEGEDVAVGPEAKSVERAAQSEPELGPTSVTEPRPPRPHLHPGTLLAVTEALAARREHYRAKLAGRLVATYDRIRAEGFESAYTEAMHLVNELPRGGKAAGRV
jgi:hypothetical protein